MAPRHEVGCSAARIWLLDDLVEDLDAWLAAADQRQYEDKRSRTNDDDGVPA